MGFELAPPQPRTKPTFLGSPRENPNWYQIKTEIRFLSGTIWVIFWGVLKTGFSLVFNLQFLDFTYLQTWDAPARVREYPIKLFKVESLGLGLRFWGLNSHRPSQNPIFGGAPEKTPFGTRLKPSSRTSRSSFHRIRNNMCLVSFN